jgi:hypothetical protein
VTNVLSELQDEIGKAVNNTKGWIEELEGKMPAVAAVAAKYEQSPIVQALESAILPPEVESALAAIISHFAGEVPASTATPAGAAPTPVAAA